MTELKQMENQVEIRGLLKTKNLEVSTRDGRNSIRGNLIVEFTDGKGNINNVRVEILVNELKRNGEPNKMYASYETIMNEYKDIDSFDREQADEIEVQGELTTYEYINGQGTQTVGNQVRGVFVNRVTGDGRYAVGATATLSAMVDNIQDETDSEGLPTGRKKADVYTVGYNSRVSKFVDLFIPEEIAEAAEGVMYPGFSGYVTLAIKNFAVIEKVETKETTNEAMGFGYVNEIKDREVSHYQRELWLVGGKPYANDTMNLDEEQVQLIKKRYKEKLASLTPRQTTPQAPQQSAAGFGVNGVSETATPEANPFQAIANSDTPVF